ncbi:MAG: hypothetical protein JNK12_08425 [Acidimicrobiales bacterium]|nr:hypothetical protein [Acidimicrobiales bacterium]
MRRSLVGALAVAAAVLLAVATAAPAGAHTDTGTFSATRAEPAADGTYTIDLLLTYDNDGHGAEDAALTVTVQGPTGGPVPVTMAPGDRAGAYTGEVAVETTGEYTVTASSTEPEASTTFTFAVAEVATTTTTAAEAPATTAADPEATTTTAADRDGTDDEGDEDGNLASIVVNGLLLIAGAAGAFFAIRWWRNRRGDASAS